MCATSKPLDLSSSVILKAEGTDKAMVQWEYVLAFSVHRNPCSDFEGEELKKKYSVQPTCGAVKKQPTNCMLQKRLLNEYNGIDLPVENTPDVTRSSNHCKYLDAHSDPDLVLDSGFSALPLSHPLKFVLQSPAL